MLGVGKAIKAKLKRERGDLGERYAYSFLNRSGRGLKKEIPLDDSEVDDHCSI